MEDDYKLYKCKICGEKLLFFVTYNDTFLNYYAAIDKYMKINNPMKLFKDYSIKGIKCLNCGHLTPVIFSKSKRFVPEQLVVSDQSTFVGIY